MNIKALKEKQNELREKAAEMLKVAETEVRGLNTEERSAFDELKSQISDITETIKVAEESRANGEKIEEQEEKRDMEHNYETEVRALEQFIRKQDGEEVRALMGTSNIGSVLPTNIENNIIQKLTEDSPVFAAARKFNSVNGTLKIARENAFTDAGFVGENTDVADNAINLTDISLTQKRVGSALSLSIQMINDSAVNIVDYAVGLLSRRVAKAVEKSILVGAGGLEFVGIKGEASIGSYSWSKGTSNPVTVNDLMKLHNTLHPAYLDGAVFIMSRAFFNVVSLLQDGFGHYYMQNGVVNGKLTYTLFGHSVIVTDVLDDATTVGNVPCLFGNIDQTYAVMIKRGFTMQHVVADTTQALRGSQLLVLDGFMDGATYNPQALVKFSVIA